MSNILSEVPSETWHQLWIVLASSTVVAGLLQGLKRWFSIGHRKNLVTALLTLLSVLATVADWLIQNINDNPLLFGRYTATILGTAVVVHRFFLSSTGVLSWLKDFNKDLKTVRDQRKEVVVPEDPSRPQFSL